MAIIKQIVQDFNKDEVLSLRKKKGSEEDISKLEKEKSNLKEEISSMKRSRSQYERWVDYYFDKGDLEKLDSSEEKKNMTQKLIESKQAILDKVENEISFLKGDDALVTVSGFSNIDYKLSELEGLENPIIKILEDQLKELKEIKEDVFYEVKTQKYKDAVDIQILKLKANIESIKTGSSVSEIYESNPEEYSQVLSHKNYSKDKYPVFYSIIGSSIILE